MASADQSQLSEASILPVQAILTLTVHGVPAVGGPMTSEFAHLRATIRTTLNGRLNPRGVYLSDVEVNDWTLHAHEAQHFEHRKETSVEVGPRRAASIDVNDSSPQDRPEEAIEMDGDGGEVGLLSQQLREIETGRRRRRRLTTRSGNTPAHQLESGPLTEERRGGGGGILSIFLQYLYDAPVMARRLSLTSDPEDATADLAVTITVTGEQTPESLSVNGKLRPEDFAYLVNSAALSSSEPLTNSLRSGGWLQTEYFLHAHAVSLVPRDDGGVIQHIPSDQADLDLLQMPSSGGRPSSSISLAGRTSTADYTSSGAVPVGLTSDSSSLPIDDEKATGIKTSRGFLLDEDSPSYVPPSYLGEVDKNDSAHTAIGRATTFNPPGDGGRVSVGLTVFIALACVSTVLLSSYLTRRTVKRSKNDRVVKARQAYDLPRKICSREWVDTLRDRITARRSRIGAANSATVDATVPLARHPQPQILQPSTIRAAAGVPPRPPGAASSGAASLPSGGMRFASGVMDTRAEYSYPAAVAARRGAQASLKMPSVSSTSGARSTNTTNTAGGGSGKRVRFGADSVAGENPSSTDGGFV
mmetsp:Transcript_20256/g.58118  ORF Transcript_20256/g.58118 Transcript_20256/m.58118 type:complete len:586 (+) Transcript_20256:184-1941(+)|eukprot:CAMPEP_0181032630 /NCGR_PEP_ID=MMETSP1070-20121207/6839_1 /TAXON_ID=265543 /ORGANISM="Minutocellus polymorphus, Strain NH13" /LENGTH=585 /DNA_ID=CAMNT_0023110029 /DNA_START=104 /DNA_END=1861 /DNA_ORIENTATION=-